MVVVRTANIPWRMRLLRPNCSTTVLNWDVEPQSSRYWHRRGNFVHDKPPGIWYGFKTSWLHGVPAGPRWLDAAQNDSSRCLEERVGHEFSYIGERPAEVRLLAKDAIATLDESRDLCAKNPDRILQLRDMRDCVAFGRIYHADARKPHGDTVWTKDRYLQIDWERVMNLYAGIEIPWLRDNPRAVQLNPYEWLCMWDVSSGVVSRGQGLIELAEVQSDPDAPYMETSAVEFDDDATLRTVFEGLSPSDRWDAPVREPRGRQGPDTQLHGRRTEGGVCGVRGVGSTGWAVQR